MGSRGIRYELSYRTGVFLVVAGLIGNLVFAYLELSGLLSWDIDRMLIVTAGSDRDDFAVIDSCSLGWERKGR